MGASRSEAGRGRAQAAARRLAHGARVRGQFHRAQGPQIVSGTV